MCRIGCLCEQPFKGWMRSVVTAAGDISVSPRSRANTGVTVDWLPADLAVSEAGWPDGNAEDHIPRAAYRGNKIIASAYIGSPISINSSNRKSSATLTSPARN